ncbi:MAG: FHA domain-containing protein [Candidatus Viridilinea halotolerans]|uniref:non-specific serine/threonine protein kinase n=1 Tax=Candidatus Viridilinea halotolerans TaxID=2491704 RepID=A0A426TUF3_9CHLR|nr:MAG: FHA domain-containing protein [Candidatus Viridilinea halotolerans]
MSLERLINLLQPHIAELAAEDVADALYVALHAAPAPPPQPTAHVKVAPEEEEEAQGGDQPPAQRTSSTHQPKSPETEEPPSKPTSPTKPPRNPDPVSPSDKRGSAGLYATPLTDSATADLSLRTPQASPLPGQAALARALRPLGLRVRSHHQMVLDENDTVRRIADTGLWLPMLRPLTEPRFKLVLVVDDTPSMLIWRQAVNSLARIVERQAALLDRRFYRLRFANGRAILLHGFTESANGVARRTDGELADPSGRTLILLVSDGVGRHWRDGSLADVLHTWTRQNHVAMLQVLPEALWARSALGSWTATRAIGGQPGTPTSQLLFQTRRRVRRNQAPISGTPLPVVRLNPPGIAAWARFAAGLPAISLPAYLIPDGPPPILPPIQRQADDPSHLVDQFLGSASPAAQQLAGLLAMAAPLTLTVARLVQEALLPKSHQVHLAEVWLSRLLRRSVGTLVASSDREDQIYDFHPGVREQLRAIVPIHDAMAVLRRVSAYIGARLGQPHDFRAWLNDGTPFAEDDPRRPFAAVAAATLYDLGGNYRELAGRLARAGGLQLDDSSESVSQSPAPEPTLPPLLSDPVERYQRGELVRSNGLAEVYSAFDRLLERPVELEIMRPELVANEALVQRFRTTASATSFWPNRGIPLVYEFGWYGESPYFSSEPLGGRTLRQELTTRGRYRWHEMVAIIEELTATLRESIFNYRIGHGALSLDCIVRHPDGRWMFTGFLGGLLPNEQASDDWLSYYPEAAPYRAPALWQGPTLNPSVDAYALLCIAYELVIGRPLVSGSLAAQRISHLQGLHVSTLSSDAPAKAQAVFHMLFEHVGRFSSWVFVVLSDFLKNPNLVDTEKPKDITADYVSENLLWSTSLIGKQRDYTFEIIELATHSRYLYGKDSNLGRWIYRYHIDSSSHNQEHNELLALARKLATTQHPAIAQLYTLEQSAERWQFIFAAYDHVNIPPANVLQRAFAAEPEVRYPSMLTLDHAIQWAITPVHDRTMEYQPPADHTQDFQLLRREQLDPLALKVGSEISLAKESTEILLPGFSSDQVQVLSAGQRSLPTDKPVEVVQLALPTTGPLQVRARPLQTEGLGTRLGQLLGFGRAQIPLAGYQLGSLIAHGGFAKVYQARDTHQRRTVAIKVYPSNSAIARIEALILRSLQGTGVIPFYGYGEDQQQAWLVLELLNGPTLRDYLASADAQPWQRALQLLSSIGATLTRMHQAGYLHGDLKPENIGLNTRHEPLLFDFSHSRYIGQGVAERHLWQIMLGNDAVAKSRFAAGTLNYSAPEVMRGEPATPSSDLYALACICEQFVTAWPTTTNESEPPITVPHTEQRVPRPWIVPVPEGLNVVLSRAWANDPDDRYPSVSAFIQALQELPRPTPTKTDPVRQLRARIPPEKTEPVYPVRQLRVTILQTPAPGQQGKSYRLDAAQAPWVIGRNESCYLTIDDSEMSKSHAQLAMVDNVLHITDLSSGGTFINEQRLTKNQRMPLTLPTVIRLGHNTTIRIDYL